MIRYANWCRYFNLKKKTIFLFFLVERGAQIPSGVLAAESPTVLISRILKNAPIVIGWLCVDIFRGWREDERAKNNFTVLLHLRAIVRNIMSFAHTVRIIINTRMVKDKKKYHCRKKSLAPLNREVQDILNYVNQMHRQVDTEDQYNEFGSGCRQKEKGPLSREAWDFKGGINDNLLVVVIGAFGCSPG